MKNTNNADSTSPTPTLNSINVIIGYIKSTKRQVKGTPSIATKIKNITSISPKLIREATFCDNKNKYFGTFTLEIMPLLTKSEVMPWFVDSLKNEYTLSPEKTYTMKCGI